jgi:peptidoglycan/LPS O-acetylase OafA/YrhL
VKPFATNAVPNRVGWLDNLKVFLTVLVIFHHAGQPYGPTGGFWQYVNSIDGSWPWLGAFFAVNAGFFMGLFFLISGYFLPAAYRKHGWRDFLSGKLLRLGVPLLAGFLILVPAGMYLYYSRYSGNPPLAYPDYFVSIFLGIGGEPAGFRSVVGFPELNLGHLWFVEHLLVYSLIFLLLQRLFNRKTGIAWEPRPMGILSVLVLGLLTAIFTWLIRLKFPVDRWIGFLGFIQMEPAHWPQYFLFFALGVLMGERNQLESFKTVHGWICLGAGLAMASVVWLRALWPDPLVKAVYTIWPVYESFMAVFLGFGLITLFRETVYRENSLTRFLARHAFAVYIIHVPVLLGWQVLLDRVPTGGAAGKFLVTGVLTAVSCWLLSWGLLKIPGVRRVL